MRGPCTKGPIIYVRVASTLKLPEGLFLLCLFDLARVSDLDPCAAGAD